MDTTRPTKHRWKPTHWQTVAIVLAVIAVVVAAGVYASIRGYESSTTRQPTKRDWDRQFPQALNQTDETDFVILATIQSVSPDTHTGSVRLYFSDYVAAHGYDYFDANNNLKQSVTVSIAGGVTDQSGPSLSNGSSDTSNSYVLAKGTNPAIDVTMNLPESEAPKYPFDSYRGTLFGTVTTSAGKLVPSFVAAFMGADGWTLSHAPFSEAKSYGMAVEIKRAADSQLYALFILVLMWALAIGGVVMALVLMRSGKHIGADHLVYLAALLFALPLMRTLLPGNPSLGVLADFAAYFWVEVVVGLTLLTLLIAWIRNNGPPRAHNPLVERQQEGSTDGDTATASRRT